MTERRLLMAGVALSVVCSTAAHATPQTRTDKWKSTYTLDIWGDPTGIDLVSHGHWHERGSSESDDPLFVVRCRKGQPVRVHVDWRQRLSAEHRSVFYEVRGGPRLRASEERSDRGFVMFILDSEALLENIEGHAHVALFSQNGLGEPVSAKFYVEDIGPAVREQCDPTVQESWVEVAGSTDKLLAASGPVYVTDEMTKPELVSYVEPEYSKEARAARIQGVVILEAVVDERGDVTVEKVLKGLSHGLTEAAVAAVQGSKYEPATLNGQPVAVYYNLTVNFQLQ